ncbi:MAG: hypothetical protein ACLGPL_06555, partial [Acidobacteriota bacterium]
MAILVAWNVTTALAADAGTASLLAANPLTGLTVNGPATVKANSTAKYTAVATFSNGKTMNVSLATTWTQDSTYATIATGGTLTTLAPPASQTATISASYTNGGITQTATKTVTILAPITLTGLAVSGPVTVKANGSIQYKALATFSNGTTQNVSNTATWTENSTYTTIAAGGILTTLAPPANQTITVKASYTNGGITQRAAQTVTLLAPVTLTGLTLSGPATIKSNSTARCTAVATFSNGKTMNVSLATTWTQDSTYATIAAGGVLTTLVPPTDQILTVSASYTNGGTTQTATKSMTLVAPVTLTGLTLSGSTTIKANSTAQYRAVAAFSNGN